LIENGKAEGFYSKEVDAQGLANLILLISLGMRLGRLLWREDFDPDATLHALFLMHSGRLTKDLEPVRPLIAGKANNGNGQTRQANGQAQQANGETRPTNGQTRQAAAR
jgi:hypothetical protein